MWGRKRAGVLLGLVLVAIYAALCCGVSTRPGSPVPGPEEAAVAAIGNQRPPAPVAHDEPELPPRDVECELWYPFDYPSVLRLEEFHPDTLEPVATHP